MLKLLETCLPVACRGPKSVRAFVSFDCGQCAPYFYPVGGDGLETLHKAFKNPDEFSRVLTANGRAVTFMPSRCREIRMLDDSVRALPQLAKQKDDVAMANLDVLLALYGNAVGEEKNLAEILSQSDHLMVNEIMYRLDLSGQELSDKFLHARIIGTDGQVRNPILQGSLKTTLAEIDTAGTNGVFLCSQKDGQHRDVVAIPLSNVAVLDLPLIMPDDFDRVVVEIKRQKTLLKNLCKTGE